MTSTKVYNNIKSIALCALLVSGTSACTMLDKKVTVVENFKLNNYLGSWYEIARLDHSFERGLSKVTANYSVDGDKVVVINRGYSDEKARWSAAEGKAYFIETDNIGRLKVSFFGPFYGAYQIHDLMEDKNGNYISSLVIGPNNDYAWILSRTPNISAEHKLRFTEKMTALGIDTQQLIWVKQ
ncbi:lipocalin family protein [Shewanella sp. 10N.286.48.A6]|uniref:lipocalin family protein n=1 Tax=Shewanella sp. 10N.286.48.A6 TaxID=1880833 RepID=UPI0018E4C9F1|nr:lipocalin family protein [Shewanella sp. 10N.286.48.A6]